MLVGLLRHLDEIAGDKSLVEEIGLAVADEPFFHTKSWPDPLHLGIFRVMLYALVREINPSYAIETGVLHGLTSAFMLRALDCNGNGRLVSVDLPSYFHAGPVNRDGFTDTLPPEKEPGWVVAEAYRHRWDLRLGNSLEILPKVFARYGKAGLFVHDSEHTYETMWGEMTLAWEHLEQGGVMVCDNVDSNTSFFDFCRRVGRIPFVVAQDLRLGNSLEILPKVFARYGKAGLFVHDSEHTYETMWGEMTLAWEHLEQGGVMVCDNVDSNTSFFDFCRRVGRIPFVVAQDRLGPIRFGIVLR